MKLKGLLIKSFIVLSVLTLGVGHCFASDDFLLHERARAFENYIPSLQFKCAHEILSVGISACDEETKNAMKVSIKEVLFDIVYEEDVSAYYFFQSALPLIEGVTDGFCRAAIMRALITVPMFERPSFVSRFLPFVEGMFDGSARALLIDDVAKNPLYRDEMLIQAAMPLLKGMNNIDERSSIMNVLSDLPRQELCAFSGSILPHLVDVIDECGRATVVKILSRQRNVLKSPEKVASMMARIRSQNAHWFRVS